MSLKKKGTRVTSPRPMLSTSWMIPMLMLRMRRLQLMVVGVIRRNEKVLVVLEEVGEKRWKMLAHLVEV